MKHTVFHPQASQEYLEAIEYYAALSPELGERFDTENLSMIRRNIEDVIRQSLGDTSVALLNGARQTGKTTLAQAIAEKTGAQYFTLDDAATLALAAGDPAEFQTAFGGPQDAE